MHALYSVRFWALQDNNLFLFRSFCEQLLYCRLPLPCGLSSYLVTRMSEFFFVLVLLCSIYHQLLKTTFKLEFCVPF